VLGTRCDGSEFQRQLHALTPRYIPPYPGDRVIPPAVYPLPLMLSEGTTARAEVMRDAWAAAWAMRFHTKAPKVARNAGKRLEAGAAFLEANRIAPVSWMRFALDTVGEGTRRVFVQTVLSDGMFRCAGMYRERSLRYASRVISYAPEQRSLAADWDVMWGDLMALPDPSPLAVAKCVALHFPDTSYDLRVETARQQATVLRRMVDSVVGASPRAWRSK